MKRPRDLEFGRRLRAARVKKGLTQRDLAKVSGCAASSIQYYEKGRVPHYNTGARLRELLEAPGLLPRRLGPPPDPSEALAGYLASADGLDLPGWVREFLRSTKLHPKRRASVENWAELAGMILEFDRRLRRQEQEGLETN